jgi:chromate transporter
MLYLQLLWVFVQVGLLSIGGGYAAIPIIQSLVVEKYGWLTLSQFTELITIAEMTPGPITINSATFVGIQLAGIPGALIATLGCIIPSCIIVILLAYLYNKYKKINGVKSVLKQLRPAVIGLIAAAFLNIFIGAVWGSNSTISISNTDWLSIGIFVLALLAMRFKKINPIIVLIFSGIIGLAYYLII